MNEIIRSEIRELEEAKDFDKLYSYLVKVVKYDDNPIEYELEFNKYFDSTDWQMRKAAVFCLLYVLQIDNPTYRNKAIAFVKDISEDEEVRRWSAAALSQTYQNTKDKELLKLFLQLVENPEEDQDFKGSILRSALLVYGLTSREQIFRNDKIMPKLDRMMTTYKREVAEIRWLLK